MVVYAIEEWVKEVNEWMVVELYEVLEDAHDKIKELEDGDSRDSYRVAEWKVQ